MIAALALAAVLSSSPIQTNASWYGWECADRPMANGEAFNPELYTCASWDYPLGTILTVTCLGTGRSVDVVVTDRGPAKHLVEQGRRIDLSEAAFAAISETRRGIERVEIR